MGKTVQSRGIPTELSLEQFRQFVLPHLTVGRRGPVPKLSLHALFNYILKLLCLGCQWKELPIAKDAEGHPGIHYTRTYGTFRSRWQAGGCFDTISTVVALKLRQTGLPRCDHHPWRWHDDYGRKGRRQPRLQWSQEGQRRQSRRLLRSQLQCDRTVCRGSWEPQRSATPASGLAKCDVNSPFCWAGPSGNDRQPGRRLRLSAEPEGYLQPRHDSQYQCQFQRQEACRTWPETVVQC